MSILNQPQFQNEEAAYKWVEARVWPNGPVCPHCGGVERISPMKGKTTRTGLYKCYQCRKPFTVKIGTIFESSHIKMHVWLQAMFLMCSGKKGISANQLHRTLGITLKSAWFMAHRIREAMRSGGFTPIGGGGKVVEADETFIGRKKGFPVKQGVAHKFKVLSLVERGGPVKSVVLHTTNKPEIKEILLANIDREARLMTDTAAWYRKRDIGFENHETVNHFAGEYVRGDAHTNTLEGYFSLFKRGMKGVYQHCREEHLHRYLAEFDFRHNARTAVGVNDEARTTLAVFGVVGKRLRYAD